MDKDPRVFLEHILDSIKAIIEYTEGKEISDFIDDHQCQDAVIRRLEIIGEATNNLSGDITNNNPHIPWLDMNSVRNKLIHEYFGVNSEIVWETIKKDLPVLQRDIFDLLEKLK